VWRWLWIAWIVGVLLTFLVLEISGYSQHGTLSEQLWRWLGMGQDWTIAYLTRRLVLGFFMIWLFLHIFFQVV